ncbi:MAG TPA: hypothetical protein VE998_11220 [Terriglobales bacterium]|nr:hypothetical protein [Terriglobales bacterium]
MPCAICHFRKEQRFCPALHDRICAVCCGTEREVSLDCPSDCPYLRQARKHEKPRPLEGLDRSALFPQVEVREQLLYEREPLLVGLSFVLTRAARVDPALRDSDVTAALADLATVYERLAASGLHYEAAVTNPIHQALEAELRKIVSEYRELEAKHLGYSSLRDGEILQLLVFMLRTAYAHTSGRPRSRAFLDFLAEKFPEQQITSEPQPAGSRIIIP